MRRVILAIGTLVGLATAALATQLSLTGAGPSSSAPVVPATLTYQSYAIDTADLTTYSFASVGIGTADSTRRVIAAAHWGASSRTLSSATIGGVSATIHVQSSGASRGVAIFSALVPTGTTATIDFTLSGGAVRAGLGVWTSINEADSAPTGTLTNTTTLSSTIDVPADGFVVAALTLFESSSTPTTVTWTGPTERYDAVTAPESNLMTLSGASVDGLAANAAYAVIATPSDPLFEEAHLVAVSWQ